MRSVRQLLRQPLKTMVGLALMTLAAAIVCLCVGQALAAQTTKKALDERFSTVGIPMVQVYMDGSVNEKSFLLDDEISAWLDEMQAQHPEIVRQQARHGFLSAYIPQLQPLNFTQEKYFPTESAWYSYKAFPETMLYTHAMLVITLDEVGEPTPVKGTYPVDDLKPEDFPTQADYDYWLYEDPSTEKMTAQQGYSVDITGTVTGVVSLPFGERNPVGRTARLTFTAPTLEQVEALNLVPGEQYIIYGMDYMDQHWKLASELNPDGFKDYLKLEEYHPEWFRFLTEAELRYYAHWGEMFPALAYRTEWIAFYNDIYLTRPQYLKLNSISMTLGIPVPLTEYEEIRDEQTGQLLELRPKTQITCTNGAGQTVTYSFDEYTSRYKVPTIAHLDGTVEEFLNSSQGEAWKAALERSEVNHQAFPVIGVDRLDYLADFSLLRAGIVEGRDFIQEERENGSRVCIIQDSLAEANGLSVGDTITLSLYAADHSLPYDTDGVGLLTPPAATYFHTTAFEETAEYTIVGLWHGKTVWPDVALENEYAFTPNTIFVPKSSVQMPMEESEGLLFNTLVLQNGKIEAFHQLALDAGYAGRYKYYDHGYSDIAVNFHNYEALAREMLVIGAVVYTVLLLLFLLLYPGLQKNNVATMQSLGCGFLRRFWHILLSTLGIVIPASVLGGWIGGQLWDELLAALQTTAESTITLELPPQALVAVALAQLLFAAMLTICVAIYIAAPRKMASRR